MSIDSDIVEMHSHVLSEHGLALLAQMLQPRNLDLMNGVDDNPAVYLASTAYSWHSMDE